MTNLKYMYVAITSICFIKTTITEKRNIYVQNVIDKHGYSHKKKKKKECER